MAPVYMVLDRKKDNSYIYYAIIDNDDDDDDADVVKIMQFDPESEGESRIKTLITLKTPTIMFFSQVDTKHFVVIDNDANVLVLKRRDQVLVHKATLYMHESDKEELSENKYNF